MPLEPVPEYLVEENAAGRTAQQCRPRIGVCNGRLGECYEAAAYVLGGANHRCLVGQRVQRGGVVALHEGQHHAVLRFQLGLDENTIADAVLHDGHALGINQVRTLVLHLQYGFCPVELRILAEGCRNVAETRLPRTLFLRCQRGTGERCLVVRRALLSDGRAEAGRLVFVVGLRAQFTLCAAIGVGCAVVCGNHRQPHGSAKGLCRTVAEGQGTRADAGLVAKLEVIQLGRADTHLWGESAIVALVRIVEEAKGGNYVGLPCLQHTETHEVGLHVLLLQLVEVGSQFLAEHTQQGVCLRRRHSADTEGEEGNQQDAGDSFHRIGRLISKDASGRCRTQSTCRL